MMQKRKGLHDLPQAITERVISEYLTEKDKLALAVTSKATQSFFQPDRLQMIVNKLLLRVMHGEQEKAEEILKRRPELLEMTGEATDYSKRTFNTTAFRYALWALDTRYMCNMMLDCLPNTSQGEIIKQGLLAQLKAHEQDGLFYKLNGVTIREKHYDFSILIEALQTYVNSYENWRATDNVNALKKQWSNVVGLAQRYVPAHVAQYFCNSATSPFNKQSFERSLEFMNLVTCKREFWFASGSATSELGINFGISGAAGAADTWGALSNAKLDLENLIALREERTADLISLIQRLKDPIQNDSHICP